jgi:hypothetical protein
VTSFDFLSLKIYINLPSKSIKQKNLNTNFVVVDVLKVADENSNVYMTSG